MSGQRGGSAMRAAIWGQPTALRGLLADRAAAERAAERLRDRPVLLVGVGTSWHAAQHGAWLLSQAGVATSVAHAADLVPYELPIHADAAVIVLSHSGTTGYTAAALARAREEAAAAIQISAVGAGGDLETVPVESSYTHTVSHTAALLRLAQIAEALGAQLGELEAVPDAVADVVRREAPLIQTPSRLIELIGAGPNAWTAQEGALKIREAAHLASEGLSAEQFFHGPSVALDDQDALVVLEGGGPLSERVEAIVGAAGSTGARITRFSEKGLGEALSIFPLTAVVQRIALDLAEARGVNPDRFRYAEQPQRERAFEAVGF